jgi:hypothetical protein
MTVEIPRYLRFKVLILPTKPPEEEMSENALFYLLSLDA